MREREYSVTVKYPGATSTFRVQAATKEEAERRALLSKNITAKAEEVRRA
jgi:hypothetical protein